MSLPQIRDDMSMHPIQQAWARLFEELDKADVALTGGTDENEGEEEDKP